MRLKILFDEYTAFYAVLVDVEVLLKALADLPGDLELTVSQRQEPAGFFVVDSSQEKKPAVLINKTVAERLKELERDKIILTARVKTIKEEIIKELQKDE